MAFESYLTYEEYISFGGTVSEDAFPLMERKAQRQLDYITFNRIQHLTVIPEVVKEVLTDFINKINAYENITEGSPVLTTYSNGIETYSYGGNSQAKLNKELVTTAVKWLPDYLTMRSVNFDIDRYLQSKNNNPE